MLIQLSEDPIHVRTFAQLYTYTLHMLTRYPLGAPFTTVFGPISAHSTKGSREQNLYRLNMLSRTLANTGYWYVLDISSFQPTIQRLREDLGVVGYPFAVVEEWSLQLIRSGRLRVLHFVRDHAHSIGAVREYDEAVAHKIPILLLD